MKNILKYQYHLLALIGFIIISLAYFYPVLQGKQILQSDIVQYTGMAKEMNDFRTEYHQESYWNNSAFGGMPTYQLGAKYPHNYIKNLDSALRFLPRPADYLFLYLLGFYILLISLKIKPLKAFFGALFFGFSTYLIIIIGAGHNAKAHAIAYMPMLVAGVIMVFQRRYWLGGILTFIAGALEIQANHFQMTYYLLLLLAIVAIFFTIRALKNKKIKPWLFSIFMLIISAILAVGVNATNLLATSEYANYSTRSNSQLTINADGTPKISDNAMTYEYITEYSYGIFETLNLLFPRITGGANNENIGTNSNYYSSIYQLLQSNGYDTSIAKQFAENAPTYWADQPIVAAPAYIGAVVIFLAILSLYSEKRKFKYIFVIGAIISILLSWGKHFPLTEIMIDSFPLYNKFRAVSSIQVIAELCIPILAILGLQAFFSTPKENQLQILKKASITFGAFILIALLGYFIVSFESANDIYLAHNFQNQAPIIIDALISDRKSMYLTDIFRTSIFASLTGLALYLTKINKLTIQYAIIAIGCLGIIDLVMIDQKYVNKDNFVPKYQVEKPFEATEADKKILADKSSFRVFDTHGAFNSARASYFHQNLGGYHAAKPRKVQELMDYHIANQNIEILNMYNVKYLITTDEQGNKEAQLNPDANGNSWFVKNIIITKNADESIEKLKSINTKETAIIEQPFAKKISTQWVLDSLANIKLTQNKSNHLIYKSENKNDGFAVFSENYYPKGWKIFIDNQPAEMLEVNYTLRGLSIPAGTHQIDFIFSPEVVTRGANISLATTIVGLLFMAVCFFAEWKRKKQNKNTIL